MFATYVKSIINVIMRNVIIGILCPVVHLWRILNKCIPHTITIGKTQIKDIILELDRNNNQNIVTIKFSTFAELWIYTHFIEPDPIISVGAFLNLVQLFNFYKIRNKKYVFKSLTIIPKDMMDVKKIKIIFTNSEYSKLIYYNRQHGQQTEPDIITVENENLNLEIEYLPYGIYAFDE
jgi:hypothetical protein